MPYMFIFRYLIVFISSFIGFRTDKYCLSALEPIKTIYRLQSR